MPTVQPPDQSKPVINGPKWRVLFSPVTPLHLLLTSSYEISGKMDWTQMQLTYFVTRGRAGDSAVKD